MKTSAMTERDVQKQMSRNIYSTMVDETKIMEVNGTVSFVVTIFLKPAMRVIQPL